ncbi:MAG TPA: GTPase ObgE [Patescibacteria group bacterium]
MIDYAKIVVKAGDGGDGIVSFFWLPGMRHGKPDGGDGGKGGDVYFEATTDLNTLEPFRYVKQYNAQNGSRGGKNNKKGADGNELTIKVPVGTVGRTSGNRVIGQSGNQDIGKLGSQEPDNQIFDMISPGQKVLIVLGGMGGRGSARFKSSTNRSPKESEPGGGGEEKNLTLELKLLADIGLIGLPNAGKSTLLSVLTSAKPKIADYPFTTLEPNLGVMSIDYRRSTIDGPFSLVIADIPGLIEGASLGKGLGEEFLRHVARSKILLHLVSLENEDPQKEYRTIRRELASYSQDLVQKKEIVILTKTDLAPLNRVKVVTSEFSKKKIKVLAISAVTHKGLEELKKEILKSLQ